VKEVASNPDLRRQALDIADTAMTEKSSSPPTKQLPSPEELKALLEQQGMKLPSGGRRKSKTLRRKFDKCVKAVRKTVKARKGSTKKQAAYAICTASILKEHGRK
jgi:ElaB/YqjD/DUF883 family membrane-anchored ribosome-binding protein